MARARWSRAGTPGRRRSTRPRCSRTRRTALRLAYERQESERAQQEASALRRSQELQRGFLSRLSHELRTPLTAIRGYASSLLPPDVTWDGESEERFLSRIAAESARLGRLVDDLLDFSAIESATLRLSPTGATSPSFSTRRWPAYRRRTPRASRSTARPDLPVVWADHDRLEQVFVNLLDNAFRHNPTGTRSGSRRAPIGSGVVVTVIDDGRGAPADITAALRAARERRRGATAGAGLGLSIARGIVEAHGGAIELERAAAARACRSICRSTARAMLATRRARIDERLDV